MRAIYMVVDLEDKELPLFVAMSAQEVADWYGTTKNAVLSGIRHAQGRSGKCSFVRIYLDDDDELIKEEMDGKLEGIDAICDYLKIGKRSFQKYKHIIPVYIENRKVCADKKKLDQWLEGDVPKIFKRNMK